MPNRYVLNFAAASARGQVARITSLLEQHAAYIEEFSVFDDALCNRFYMRSVFRPESDAWHINLLQAEYQQLLREHNAQGQIWDMQRRVPVLIMVSKTDHCLRTLMSAYQRGDLNIDIVGIASNHPDLEPIARHEGIPYHYLPVNANNRAMQEAQILDLLTQTGAEFMVLARYMQVLTPNLCAQLAGRAVNIHHSFLPGFQGAKPYEQAHARGVKLIGATAHYVTPHLDEGPIIEQSVERVDHAYSPEDLLRTGRHIESTVLERALRHLVERRVFINGERTVILR
ncbi:MAG: formyltetrahydrofolate deformylase [Formosimonas sp.]